MSDLKSSDLWLKIINEGVEDRVEVNQRMLIDKMLARYSSDFVIYRELIQNSDDAQSTSFTLQITCDPSSSTLNYQSINKISSRSTNQILGGLGQLFKNSFGLNSNEDENNSNDLSQNQFNNCLINEIRTINNGNVFNDDDWKRVITIAEGNTNVDAIGQFGVGFFSVFSYSEKPMIQSGKYCLAFAWQNGKCLTTFRKELPLEEQSSTTSIILPMKNQFILQTKTNSSIQQNHSTKAKKNVQTNEIVPTLDLTQLKTYFTKVLSFTKFIKQLIIQINGQTIFQVNKTIKPLENNKFLTATKLLNENIEHQLLRFNSFKQTEQKFTIENGPSIDLFHYDVQAQVYLDKQFQKQIEQVIKKSLPSTIQIQFLFPSNHIFEEEQLNNQNQMLKELIPLKIEDGQICPSGQIFIGLATHQSTGIGMHVFTHLIPTIERENIDLQDPYISIWNEQLLTSIGKIVRFIYDQTILHIVNNTQQSNQLINTLLSPFAFRTSAPNQDIGRLIIDGFFSMDRDILVPVKRCPSDKHLSLIPSTEAFLSNSKHIQSFLPIPLVPFEIGKNEFFKTLKRQKWIEEINSETIVKQIHQSILSTDEFVGLLRWLCTNDVNNKSYIKNVLSKIRYRESRHSAIINLDQIEYYDTLNIPLLPLPDNVLPSDIVAHISREDLQKRLSLSAISTKTLIEFYLQNANDLFLNEKTAKIILSFISQRLNQLNSKELNDIKDKFSNLKCIPTSEGMKIPNESYTSSFSNSSNLSIIKLYIPQISKEEELDEYPVSIEFLKSIGCRTIYVPTSTKDISSEQFQNNEHFIEDLLKQRKNLSENDLKALKNNQSIVGRTLDSDPSKKRKYKPSELHFPSVAKRLEWNTLLILDWIDIDQHSREYSFLKELGVREVPHLNQLILTIDQEYQNGSKIKKDFQLPKSLIFFAENFQEHYSKMWKNFVNNIPFLPSSLPHSNQESTDVILTTPTFVFKEFNPFFPSLLPDVIRCFSLYFDISLIGVQSRPNILMAFTHLMEKKNELLTVENAPKSFSYLNQLDGINKNLIDNLSKISFIPFPGNNKYLKPSEVFIRSTNIQITDEDQKIARGLIDYIDYGEEANSFLTTIGVLNYPSIVNLANLLIQRQQDYFGKILQENEEIISAKLRFYTNCLKQLSIASDLTEQLKNEPLKSRLRNCPWCLAYQTIEQSNKRIFQIVKPSEVYLDDDHQSAQDIHPLCAPDEPELIKLYQRFGSKWLSENVQRYLIHTGKSFSTERSKKLFDLINQRLDMLFVNNRGEKLENFDEKRFQLLKSNFSVFECEGIQCQLIFQKKKITLNSSECSSCALEFPNENVYLFLGKDFSTIDYIDISTELTRFIFHKTIETLIHSISDKLSSTLQTLKRRGIPVERLLKTTQQQPIHFNLQLQQNQTENILKEQSKPIKDQQQHRIDTKMRNQGGLFQGLKDLLIPSERKYSSEIRNSIENVQSEIRSEEIEDFGCHQLNDQNEMLEMMRKIRPYQSREFVQPSTSRYETNNSCEFLPESNLIRHENLLNGISIYFDENIPITSNIIQQGKILSFILFSLSKQVFQIPIETIHLFRDIKSARIAFNTNGSLFYNLRYFEQVFSDQLEKSFQNGFVSSSSSEIIRKLLNFYYIVTCHELSHNLYSNHDFNFLNHFEKVSVYFMDKKDQFLPTFSFQIN